MQYLLINTYYDYFLNQKKKTKNFEQWGILVLNDNMPKQIKDFKYRTL